MIISASRRDKIFRLYIRSGSLTGGKAGEVLVPNPYNRKKISRIERLPDTIDCIAFWTKNPEPLIPYLSTIDKMGSGLFPDQPLWIMKRILRKTFLAQGSPWPPSCCLASAWEKSGWTGGLISFLLTEKYSISYHLERFEMMCEWLHKATTRCKYHKFYRFL